MVLIRLSRCTLRSWPSLLLYLCLLVPCHLNPLPGRQSACKNRASPYRVILKNENYEQRPSKHTPRQPSRKPASPTQASPSFKIRVLNAVHLDQSKLYDNNKLLNKDGDNEFHVEERRDNPFYKDKSIEKHQKKENGYEKQYGYQYSKYKTYHSTHKPYQHTRGPEPPSSDSCVRSLGSDTSSSSNGDDIFSLQNTKLKVFPSPSSYDVLN